MLLGLSRNIFLDPASSHYTFPLITLVICLARLTLAASCTDLVSSLL